MKKLLLFVSLFLSAAVFGEVKLVWSDEFEGETVDWTKWSKVPPVTSGNAAEWRKYTSTRDDLVSVGNGVLTLRGIANDGADPSETRAFLCGQLWSKGKAAFTRGIFEIRAKFENQQGAWPALWMLPEKNNWPLTGEIDFVERLNSDKFVHQTVHHGPVVDGSSTSDTSHDNKIDPEGWNVYRVEWTKTSIVWYVNGEKTFTYAPIFKNSDKWPFTTPFYLILSQQLEGNWVGQVDPATLPVNMYVDYVRVYQDEDEPDPITIEGGRTDLAFTGVETPKTLFRDRDQFQPLIGMKADSLPAVSPLYRLTLELPAGVDQSFISEVKLFKSTVPDFDLANATDLWNGLSKTRTGNKIQLSFQKSGNYPILSVNDYLWVAVKVSPDAPVNSRLDAKISEIVVNGYFSWVFDANPRGYALVTDMSRFTSRDDSVNSMWTLPGDSVWNSAAFLIDFKPISFSSMSAERTVTTINLIASLPKNESGVVAGWKIGFNKIQLVYDAENDLFDLTYNGNTTHSTTRVYSPLDVSRAHAYTIVINSQAKGVSVYQDGNLIVDAPRVFWTDKTLAGDYTIGSIVDGSSVYRGLGIFAADIDVTAAENSRDRILPARIVVNGRELDQEGIRSVTKLFGPLVEEVEFAVDDFDFSSGEFFVKANHSMYDGSVSLYGATSLDEEWTPIKRIESPKIEGEAPYSISISSEQLKDFKFFKAELSL